MSREMKSVRRIPSPSREVRAHLRRLADEHPERWRRVCLAIAQMEGWAAFPDPRWCVNLVRQRLNGRTSKAAKRGFDADWLGIVLDVFPESEIPALFLRRAAKAEARRELSEGAA